MRSRVSKWKLAARGSLIIPGLLILPGLLQASLVRPAAEVYTPDVRGTPSARAEQQYARIRDHLQAPFDGYADPPGLSVSGWKIAALSHMAAGLMSLSADAREAGDTARQAELAALLAEVATRATRDDISPYRQPLLEIEDFNDWGFYLGHLSLILGCARYTNNTDTTTTTTTPDGAMAGAGADASRDAAAGMGAHDLLHRRIVRYQLARMAADGDQHARSYPNSHKWPADQALTLAGAHLYDRIHGSNLSVVPVRTWLDTVAALSAETGGLHPMALTNPEALPILNASGTERLPPLPYAGVPRGSALGPTAFYMAQFAPEDAAALYAAYRSERFHAPLGLGGFAEWPADHARQWDIEGGPVVLGLGVVASGMGLGPARLFGDPAAYTATLRSSLAFGVPLGGDRLLAPLLGEAILFSALTARPWFEPPPPLPEDIAQEPPPAPLGAWLLTLLDLGLIGALAAPPLLPWLSLRRQPRASASSEAKTETRAASPGEGEGAA